MVNVAVAGGKGQIGLVLTEAFQANPKHEVIVLTRKDPEPSELNVFAVNYSDVESLTELFSAHKIHTVVSAIQVNSPDSSASEINLVRAAVISNSPQRFIASGWAMPISEPALKMPHDIYRDATITELSKTDLEWTTVHVGQIMDHLGLPRIKSPFSPYIINFDIGNRAASIPGTGNEVISLTYSYDIAKFVTALIEMPMGFWKHQTFCYSDSKTFNEVLKLAEEATETKFFVTYDAIEKLEKGEMTELPGHVLKYSLVPKDKLQARLSKFGLYAALGMLRVPEEQSLNQIMPGVRTTTVADIVHAWKEK